MGHNKIVKNSIIRDNSGGVMHIATDGENDKYYAVVVKCGHVGVGYFIPVCFAVMAKDLESAIKLAKERSRVQRDRKDCVFIAAEITAPEYYLIHYHNDRDAYITTNYAAEDVEHIERRRIISPELLQDVLNGKDERLLKGGRMQHVPLLEEIKTADKYLDYQTFQKAFAPRVYGDKYVFPTRFNAREVLDKYYTEIAVLQGILKKKAYPLVLYYQIFGEGNEIGLTYNSGEMKYVSLNGNTVYVPVSEAERAHIESSSFVRAKQPKAPEAMFEDIEYTPTTSAMDKFNRRMQRHQEITGKQAKPETEPGE